MPKRTVLDNARINALSRDPTFVREFNFFALRKDKKGCCGRRKGTEPDYQSIKQKILSLSAEQKKRLRALLGDQEVLIYHNDGQTVKQIIF